MNNSGDAAEQIVRMSLEGTEVALKLTGSAAKNIAAAIYSVLKNRDKTKTKGRQRLTAMLKSGKELKVFTISEEHLKQFATEARRYGVVYCALRGKDKSDDGFVDVMVRAEDASKINRIVERFKLSTVDAASIKSDIQKNRTEKADEPSAPEKDIPDIGDDALLDDLMTKPIQKDKTAPDNPAAEKSDFFQKSAAKSRPSEPTFGKQRKTDEGISKPDRPSVREELEAIRKEQKEKSKSEPVREDAAASENKAPQKSAQHKQPERKKPKKKNKER